MPLFDYKCPRCNKSFEKIIKNISEKVTCECGNEAEKLFHPTSNFFLKGNCWSKDNYTRKGDKCRSLIK